MIYHHPKIHDTASVIFLQNVIMNSTFLMVVMFLFYILYKNKFNEIYTYFIPYGVTEVLSFMLIFYRLIRA